MQSGASPHSGVGESDEIAHRGGVGCCEAAKRKIRVNFFRLGNAQPFAYGSELCVPSQKGMFLECLHAHHATVPASLISTCFGSRPVPLWLPSQNGWLCDLPHAHHQ